MENIGIKLREAGWMQGVIVPASLIWERLPDDSPVTDEDHAIVVSQSCDLIHHNLVNEPFAVFLLLKRIPSSDPGFLHGKNPRRLHFQSVNGDCYETWAWNQVRISRDQLVDKIIQTSFELDQRTLRNVLDWLAKRFTRIAFPDDFNDLLKPKSKEIGNLLKKNQALFSEILLSIEPFDELSEGQGYQLSCHLLMEADVHDDQDQHNLALQVAAQLEKLFDDSSIEVVDCSPVSEAALTVAELNRLVHWDFDYLTHRHDANDPPA